MGAKIKILAIRIGRAGDIVMMTAALKTILDKWPEAELHVLTSPDGKRVLNGFHERLTEVIIYQRKGIKGLLERGRVKKKINKTNYDKIFCFELKKSFLSLVDQQTAPISQITEEDSIINYALRCLKVVCQDDELKDRWLYLPVTEQGMQLARAQLRQHDINDDDFVIGLHPSFSGFRKLSFRSQDSRVQRSWPADHFAKLAMMFADYAGTQSRRIFVIMDVVPEDRELAESIIRLSGGRVIMFILPLNFERYKALLHRMNLLISPNTGPMHIAAAVGTNLVTLFAGHDPRDCAPYVPDSQFRVLRAEDMPQPQLGLAAISPEKVFEACKTFLP